MCSLSNSSRPGNVYIRCNATDTATRYNEAAARAGITPAAAQLAVLLIDGRGVAEDKVSAHAWLILAADDGVPGAAMLRDQLTTELGPSDWSEALRRSLAIRAQ